MSPTNAHDVTIHQRLGLRKALNQLPHVAAVSLCALAISVLPYAKAFADFELPTVVDLLGGSKAIRDAGAQFNASIDHAKDAGMALLAAGNADAKARLDQINQIANNALDRASAIEAISVKDTVAILNQATLELNAIEDKTFSDINQTIWNVRCQGRAFVITDLGTALGALGRFVLGTDRIYITPPFKRLPSPMDKFLGRDQEVVFKVKEPFDNTYIEVRDYMLQQLSTAKDSDPAHPIVATYEYIAEFAKLTSCFFQGGSEAYNLEYVDYYSKAREWRNLLQIRVVK